MERPDNSQIPYHIRKPASDKASDIMEAVSPRGPASFGTLSNEKWNLGHELITAALCAGTSGGVEVVGLPMLVKNSRGWEVLGEDGARYRLSLVSAAPLIPSA